ncbi:MAG: proline iminopeptidase, partial [Rhodospirillaceae bacterium]|nr:proline iminopeptidase [Rhodospirillaceae bacterium]
IKVFENASHLSMWEVPEAYFEVLLGFLDSHRG